MSPPCVGHSEAGDKAGFDEEESRRPAWGLVEALVAAEWRRGSTRTRDSESAWRPKKISIENVRFSAVRERETYSASRYTGKIQGKSR
jgi:hypothetical protein